MSTAPTKVKTLQAHIILAELQEEGRYERNLSRFEADAEVEMPRLRQSGDPFYQKQFSEHDETT